MRKNQEETSHDNVTKLCLGLNFTLKVLNLKMLLR